MDETYGRNGYVFLVFVFAITSILNKSFNGRISF